MPDINTDVWGEGFYTDTSGLNKRTGAADISAQDYEDYKPFSYISQTTTPPAPETWSRSLHNIYARGGIELNAPIDESICYVGMYNEELPQLNIGVYYRDSTQENPAFKTDNTAVQSFFLYGTYSLYYTYPNRNYMPNGFMPVPDYENYTKYIYWSPEAYSAAYPDTTNYNTNLKIDPYLKWGIRSLFLVIYVQYVNTYDATGMPVSTMTTLNDYLNGTGHDDAWKSQHKVLCAFGMPYIRRSTAGLYDSTLQDNCSVTPAFTLPCNGQYSGDTYNILMYIATLQGNSLNTRPDNVGAFPIYGSSTPWVYTFPYGGSTAQQGYIHFGTNKGEMHTNVNNVHWFELDLTVADNVEYLMRGCAAYGLFFSDDYYTLGQEGRDETRWIDNNMCCGTIDDEGRTNGDYTRGVLNALQRQFNWSDSTQSPFDPSLPPVPENEYSHTTVFNTIGDLATLTKRYVLSASDVALLGTELFKVTDDIFTQYSDMKDYVPKINSAFLTNNPLDCIVSLQKYPIEIPKAATPENIRLGSIQTNAIGYKFDAPCLTFLFGGKKIMPRFGNSFLDYNPFTRFEIYVPFCGTVDLNPADILNRVLNVELIIDMSTGTCTGYIESGDLVIETVNGNVAIDIPVSGIDAATVNANLNNAAVNARTAFNNKRANSGLMSVSNNVGITDVLQPWKWGGKATSMVASSLNSGYAAQKANYDLMHTQAPVHVIGSVSPVGAWAIDLNCRLLVYYPTGNIFDLDGDGLPVFNSFKLSQFGALQGFATAETGNLNQYKGLTIAVEPRYSNMRTNSATNSRALSADELDLITAALSEGIINNIS